MSHGLLLHPGSPFPWTEALQFHRSQLETQECAQESQVSGAPGFPAWAEACGGETRLPGGWREGGLQRDAGRAPVMLALPCPERQPRHSREHNRGLCVRDLARWQTFQGSTALSCRKEPGWGRAAACPPGRESKGWGDECPACPPAPPPPLIFIFHWRDALCSHHFRLLVCFHAQRKEVSSSGTSGTRTHQIRKQFSPRTSFW